jgi:hypothetical protein
MKHRAYFAWCAAIVASSLIYVLPAFTPIPLLWYHPAARFWELAARPDGFATGWYGRTSWAVLGAAIAFALAWLATTRRQAPSRRAFLVWAAWAGMTSVLAIAVYSYQLAYRQPVPEPLPADYVPR